MVYKSSNATTTTKNAKFSGVGNIKIKLKHWIVQWKRNTGLGLSLHTKFPIDDKKQALTSGSTDISALMHFAIPIGEKSGYYLTAGGTTTEKNYFFEDWPRYTFVWMIDSSLDISISDKWNLFLGFGFQGPFMNRKHLLYDANLPTKPTESSNGDRNASNFSALANVRGQQILGFKRYLSNDDHFMIYLTEDWAAGDKKETGNFLYSHNQPDVAIGFRYHMGL
jgi:hypothetical protein